MSKRDEIEDLVKRYEEALSEGRSIYFDADQFSDLAVYYDAMEDLDSAKELLDVGLRIHPENEQLLIKRAKILVYEGEYGEALKILRVSVSSSSYEYELYLLQIECLLQMLKEVEATELVRIVLEEETESLNTVYAEIGFLYSDANYYSQAISFFERSIQIHPAPIEVLSDLGYCYEMQGNFKDAMLTYNKLLDIDPYNYNTWLNLSKLQILEDDYATALDSLDFALTINDSDVDILKLKAHCLSVLGREQEAIELFEILLGTEIEDSSIYLLVSECYTNLSLFDRALDSLNSYKNLEGETQEYFIKKIALYVLMDQLSHALNVTEEAMSKLGELFDLLIIAGNIKYDTQNYREARQDYLKAYALNSSSLDVLDRLSVTDIKLGLFDSAISHTELLLLLGGDEIEVKQRLALLYFEVDDKEKFNSVLDDLNEDELGMLFSLFYSPEHPELFDRGLLVRSLNEARECRTLFKNLKY